MLYLYTPQINIFSSDEESPVKPSECHHHHPSTDVSSPAYRRTEFLAPVHHNPCHLLTSTTDQFLTDAWDEDSTSTKEHFPTVPLKDDVWTKDPIPDRQLCIHETPQPNNQCPYPCPYTNLSFGMNLLQSPPWDTAVFGYEIIDLSNISSNIMTTSSDNDIPDLRDISDCLDNLQDWFA